MKPSIVSALLGIIAVMISGCAKDESPKVLTLTASVYAEIPVRMIDAPDIQPVFDANPGYLAATPGYEDELPQGPSSFDVLDDGGLVIADPLRERLVFYGTDGGYVSQRTLDFAALRVRSLGDGQMLVQRAGMENFYLSSAAAPPSPVSDTKTTDRIDTHGTATLNSQRQGAVTPTDGSAIIPVTFENDSLFLISVQNLGSNNGLTYILMEATTGKTPISIYRYMRAYDAEGQWIRTISDLASGHHVFPEDEFRIAGGDLYQMVPGVETVRIYRWKTP